MAGCKSLESILCNEVVLSNSVYLIKFSFWPHNRMVHGVGTTWNRWKVLCYDYHPTHYLLDMLARLSNSDFIALIILDIESGRHSLCAIRSGTVCE